MTFEFDPNPKTLSLPIKAKDIMHAIKSMIDTSKLDADELRELRAEVWDWNEQLEKEMEDRAANPPPPVSEDDEDTQDLPIWFP